jgi:hypothetical protein
MQWLDTDKARDTAARRANVGRFDPERDDGHYESYFLRANHSTRPIAFWIRYTLMVPRRARDQGIGELWAIWFDGEIGRHTAAKTEVSLARAAFSRDGLDVAIGDATLGVGRLQGSAGERDRISWDLGYGGGQAPLIHLPSYMYEAPLPRAKSLVAKPLAQFEGTITVNDEQHEIGSWVGSQNHNWGSRHTDMYAWGQVAGFDNDPSAFLEVASARLRLGSWWTPRMAPLVLRHRGAELRMNSLGQSLRAVSSHRCFEMHVSTASREATAEVRIRANPEDFIGLRYRNPPGGEKHCLNSKLATCEVTLRYRTGEVCTLSARRRAAFEILTDERDHGIPVLF